ncbi:MAG: hypothetical protein EHM34_09740 [Nitrosopumilales archaeon]|nr:MAG: hypothetical protein EHM34_09740 [Nitrosopumilales archaeon]
MLDLETLREAPIPMLKYLGHGEFIDGRNSVKDENVLVHWLFQYCGETYRLEWWNNGWVVCYQESFLTKDLHFKHKNDIPSFDFSHFGSSEGWQHVFQKHEDAIETFKKFWTLMMEGEDDFDSEKQYK